MRTGKLSVAELLASKGKVHWVQIHVDGPEEAAAAAEAGIRILSCEPDRTLEAVRAAAPLALISAGMPHGAVATPDEAVRLGFDILRRGADAVYCSHSTRFIERMAREGIPVTGHVGLVPNLAAWTGFRAIGKMADEAVRVLRKARDIENAGAALLEVEVVPVELAAHLTRSVSMITMGMGCGSACDTQYLFSCDLLGTNRGHYPRHSKRYADLAAEEDRLQALRVEAMAAFRRDVETGAYPEAGHQLAMDPGEHERFLELASRL